MKYLIIFSLIILPIYEEIDYSEVDIENEKAVILYIQPIACHVCYIEIDKRIKRFKEKNFKYYILLDSKRSIVERKKIISVYKEHGLDPDKYIFALESEKLKEFNKEYNISYSPVLILNNKWTAPSIWDTKLRQILQFKLVWRHISDRRMETP